jgi:cobalt-zinc-cadmium efflux system membrane fusion protein
MQEDYATATANIEYLQVEYERQKTLSEENVSAKKVFQEVKSKLAVEQARAKAAKTRMEMLHVSIENVTGGIPILSPISGYVGEIYVNTGAYAEVGKPLFEVIDNNEMHLDLNVYEKDLSKIREGQNVDVVLTNQNNRTLKATVFAISKTFANESKSVAVHAHIKGNDTKGLISGMYLSANINVNNARVTALPKDAVVKSGEKHYIFVEKGEEEREIEAEEGEEHNHTAGEKHSDHEAKPKQKVMAYRPVEVIAGVTDLGFTEITPIGDLPQGAKIVTVGAFYLLSAMNGSEGHEH